MGVASFRFDLEQSFVERATPQEGNLEGLVHRQSRGKTALDPGWICETVRSANVGALRWPVDLLIGDVVELVAQSLHEFVGRHRESMAI